MFYMLLRKQFSKKCYYQVGTSFAMYTLKEILMRTNKFMNYEEVENNLEYNCLLIKMSKS